jgi:hypothetical protein
MPVTINEVAAIVKQNQNTELLEQIRSYSINWKVVRSDNYIYSFDFEEKKPDFEFE